MHPLRRLSGHRLPGPRLPGQRSRGGDDEGPPATSSPGISRREAGAAGQRGAGAALSVNVGGIVLAGAEVPQRTRDVLVIVVREKGRAIPPQFGYGLS